jgi:hypothetical protein
MPRLISTGCTETPSFLATRFKAVAGELTTDTSNVLFKNLGWFFKIVSRVSGTVVTINNVFFLIRLNSSRYHFIIQGIWRVED